MLWQMTMAYIVFGLVYAEIDVSKIELEADSLFKAICEIYSGTDTYETVKTGYVNFYKCISALEIPRTMVVAKEKAEWREVLTTMCEKIPDLAECTENFKSISKLCFSIAGQRAYDASLDSINVYAQALCDEKLQDVIDFSIENGIDCYMSNIKPIVNCISGAKITKLDDYYQEDTEETTDEEAVEKCFKLSTCD